MHLDMEEFDKKLLSDNPSYEKALHDTFVSLSPEDNHSVNSTECCAVMYNENVLQVDGLQKYKPRFAGRRLTTPPINNLLSLIFQPNPPPLSALPTNAGDRDEAAKKIYVPLRSL